jgi:hypothetical protein
VFSFANSNSINQEIRKPQSDSERSACPSHRIIDIHMVNPNISPSEDSNPEKKKMSYCKFSYIKDLQILDEKTQFSSGPSQSNSNRIIPSSPVQQNSKNTPSNPSNPKKKQSIQKPKAPTTILSPKITPLQKEKSKNCKSPFTSAFESQIRLTKDYLERLNRKNINSYTGLYKKKMEKSLGREKAHTNIRIRNRSNISALHNTSGNNCTKKLDFTQMMRTNNTVTPSLNSSLIPASSTTATTNTLNSVYSRTPTALRPFQLSASNYRVYTFYIVFFYAFLENRINWFKKCLSFLLQTLQNIFSLYLFILFFSFCDVFLNFRTFNKPFVVMKSTHLTKFQEFELASRHKSREKVRQRILEQREAV